MCVHGGRVTVSTHRSIARGQFGADRHELLSLMAQCTSTAGGQKHRRTKHPIRGVRTLHTIDVGRTDGH